MVKVIIDGEFVELKEGDRVIQVAFIDTYSGVKLMCRVDNEFAMLQSNVQENVTREFDALSLEEREKVMKGLANKAGSLVTTHIKPMLRSEYEKETTYTEGSLLFCHPK